MAPSWKDDKTKTKQEKKNVISLRPAVTSVFFISSSYSIRKQNPNPCSILQCHLLKSGSLCPPWEGGETRAEARTRRKSLHLCSPLRRGKRASLGNRKPNRAIVRRIQAGRFCIWCLMNCGKTRKYIIRKSILNHNCACQTWIVSVLKMTSQPLICHNRVCL